MEFRFVSVMSCLCILFWIFKTEILLKQFTLLLKFRELELNFVILMLMIFLQTSLHVEIIS